MPERPRTMSRVEWREIRRVGTITSTFFIIGDMCDDEWVFGEQEAGAVRWDRLKPTSSMLDKAESLLSMAKQFAHHLHEAACS